MSVPDLVRALRDLQNDWQLAQVSAFVEAPSITRMTLVLQGKLLIIEDDAGNAAAFDLAEVL